MNIWIFIYNLLGSKQKPYRILKQDKITALYQTGEDIRAGDVVFLDEASGKLFKYTAGQSMGAKWKDEDPDINICPGCGGEADNGFSRSLPPYPYFCTKCDKTDA